MYNLDEARLKFIEEAQTVKGGRCPCCNRFGKVYKRKLSRPMARGLVWLFSMYEEHGDVFVGIGDMAPRHVVRSNGSVSSNEWWGLAEEKPNPDDPSKKTSGYWKITIKGRNFVKGYCSVPSHCIIFNKNILGFTGEQVLIQAALGRPFSYKELMGERGTLK